MSGGVVVVVRGTGVKSFCRAPKQSRSKQSLRVSFRFGFEMIARRLPYGRIIIRSECSCVCLFVCKRVFVFEYCTISHHKHFQLALLVFMCTPRVLSVPCKTRRRTLSHRFYTDKSAHARTHARMRVSAHTACLCLNACTHAYFPNQKRI